MKHLRLTVRSDLFGEYTVKPECVAENAAGLPVQDLILISVKNDSLEQIIDQIAPAVGPDTAVMTVMNGVSAGRRLREKLSEGHAMESVIYIVSGAGEDFTVIQQGKFAQIFAGSTDQNPESEAACRKALGN